jgi:hypothetical protein
MRKFTLLFFATFVMVLMASVTSAQTSKSGSRAMLYSDDFESYAVGDFVAVVSPEFWTTWTNTPGSAEDALIVDNESSSPTQSFKVDGTTDLILKLGDKTTGKYEVSWMFMVPANYAGYYNIQHYEAPGVEWASELYFREDGSGSINAGGTDAATFTYNHDEWFRISNVVDLEQDSGFIYFNDVLIHAWQWSLQATGEAGVLQLGGVDFFAGVVSGSGESPLYYVDDVTYEAITEQFIYSDDFESYTAGDYVAVVSPEFWTTWTNTPGSAEDALIVDSESSSPTQSFKVDGSTDLILKLGDKTTGVYEVNWMYMVPTGFCGYYNIQHYEAPGVEWGSELYFMEDGSGTINAGGEAAASFTYTHDVWFKIRNVVDLELDSGYIYFNDALIYQWQWSLQATGEPGALQLGGVDFFAGALTGTTETPTYYVDDVEYLTIVEGAASPAISIPTSPIILTAPQGTMQTHDLLMTNTGGTNLNFKIINSYNEPTSSLKQGAKVPAGSDIISNGVPQFDPSYNPGPAAPANRDVTLNYDGENASAIGLTNANQWRVSARFDASMVEQYNGMYLTSVDVFVNDLADAHKIQIYDMGNINLPGPGALLYEQDFFPNIADWTTVVLVDPVYISGTDIWIGYWMDQPAGIFPAGVDAGPVNPDGDWMSSGPGWGHLSDNPDFQVNWNIRGTLTGEAGVVWLSTNPSEGVLEPAAEQNITVTVDASDLQELSIYKGKLHVQSNDPVNEQLNISVWITVLVGVNENGEKAYVSVYPNPANDVLNVVANTEISSVSISNNLGQVVYSQTVNKTETMIRLDEFKTGMYFVRIETANGTATQKLMVE